MKEWGLPARLFAASGALSIVLAFCALQRPVTAQTPPLGPITVTFNNNTSSASLCNVTAQNSASFYASSATTGPIDAQVSVDGVNWTATNIATMGGTTQAQPFTPTNGTTYQIAPIPGGCVRVIADSTWGSQTMTVVLRAQGAIPNLAAAGGGSTVAISSPLCNSGAAVCVQQQAVPLATTPVSTPSSGPAPTASAGAAQPGNAVQTEAYNNCAVPAGATPNVTVGNAVAMQCGTNGALNVNIPAPTATLPVTTPAPQTTVSPGAAPAAGLCTSAAGCLPSVGDTTVTQAITTTLTQIIAAPGAGSIRIAALQSYLVESATGGAVELEYGTGTNCATGTTVLAILQTAGATTSTLNPTFSWGTGYGVLAIVPATKALCVVASAGTVSIGQILITYTVY